LGESTRDNKVASCKFEKQSLEEEVVG